MVGSCTRQWLLNSASRRPETLLMLTNCIQSFQPYRLHCLCKYFCSIFSLFLLISRVDWSYGLNKNLNIFLICNFLDCGLLGCNTGCTRQLIWSVEGECSLRLQLADCVEDGNKIFLRDICLTKQSPNSEGPVGKYKSSQILKYRDKRAH
jgi:hypothetical protein